MTLSFERLAEIVSDSLAATTMGTDYAEAPEPSDEPGSPYVRRLTNEMLSRLPESRLPLRREAFEAFSIEPLARALLRYQEVGDGRFQTRQDVHEAARDLAIELARLAGKL